METELSPANGDEIEGDVLSMPAPVPGKITVAVALRTDASGKQHLETRQFHYTPGMTYRDIRYGFWSFFHEYLDATAVHSLPLCGAWISNLVVPPLRPGFEALNVR